MVVGSSPLARGLLQPEQLLARGSGIIPARAGFTSSGPRRPRSAGDHPRSRGVYLREALAAEISEGSSPLARGLRGLRTRALDVHRIIPARAGFTRVLRRSAPWRPDHPRSRGVYSSPRLTPEVSSGSSPLARGLLAVVDGAQDRRGIIPARAGFTLQVNPFPCLFPDHPRSRGVYAASAVRAARSSGSSPLARGLQPPRRTVVRERRIIPARAGFTHHRARERNRTADHPRSRGVYPGIQRCRGHAAGSSPLARGLPPLVGDDDAQSRIIPARAGFTQDGVRQLQDRRDHPRSRGVYAPGTTGTPTSRGSSPLARGLPPAHRSAREDSGIIPARAGFTPASSATAPPARDHPRSRGVYLPGWACEALAEGSSPLARGLRHHHARRLPDRRIIPARAGFTPLCVLSRARAWDHPRSRGVYWRAWPDRAPVGGSSPLARGLLPFFCPPLCAGGIIPARAGFTPHLRPGRPAHEDHPRSRGVYAVCGSPCPAPGGSSPLARGLLLCFAFVFCSYGIIPARAGFTPCRRPSRRCRPDHPRSRGVYRSPSPPTTRA